MDCESCGGLLKPNSNVCHYCGRKNDTDLKGFRRSLSHGAHGKLECPRCDETTLRSLTVTLDEAILLDRCEICFGIFFDPDELEFVISSATANVNEADLALLDAVLLEEACIQNWPVTYIPCPSCNKRMNRKLYGSRSGVVIDTCKGCGVWLDGGELRKILRWVKAGGQIHNAQRELERREQQEREKARAKAEEERAFVKALRDSSAQPSLLQSLAKLFSSLA